MEAEDDAALDKLVGSELGRVRSAPKETLPCVGTNPIRKWLVMAFYGDGGWNCATYYEAEPMEDAVDAIRLGERVANAGGEMYDRVEVLEVPNPNYNPGCLGPIPPGDRYFLRRKDAVAWEQNRYCARCAAVFLP